MDFVIFLVVGIALGSLLGFAAGLLYPAARHGALWCFLAGVGLFWLYCSFFGGSLFEPGSLLALCYGIFMRVFYGAFLSCLAAPAYYFGRFLRTHIKKAPPA